MYRQPIITDQRPSLEPSLCSGLIDKMVWKLCKRKSDKKMNVPTQTKTKSSKYENTKSNKTKHTKKILQKQKHELNLKKLGKITMNLALAVNSKDAFEKGKTNCETCAMDREEYKRELQTVKLIDMLVDSVIGKEQAILIDDENDSEDTEDDSKYVSETESKYVSETDSSKGKGDKISFQLEIYSEKYIKHNLKCLLIRLQKSIGDLMVQTSFVKTRKLTERRYKKFDFSISEFKLLRFEYTNLIDFIIPLFKKPPLRKASIPSVCVACVKDKVDVFHGKLEEMIKSGRKLILVMRNDETYRSDGQCCSRLYPHVHAEVHGKPIVLKFSKLFKPQSEFKPKSGFPPELTSSEEELEPYRIEEPQKLREDIEEKGVVRLSLLSSEPEFEPHAIEEPLKIRADTQEKRVVVLSPIPSESEFEPYIIEEPEKLRADSDEKDVVHLSLVPSEPEFEPYKFDEPQKLKKSFEEKDVSPEDLITSEPELEHYKLEEPDTLSTPSEEKQPYLTQIPPETKFEIPPSAEKKKRSLSRDELPYDQLPDDFINNLKESSTQIMHAPLEDQVFDENEIGRKTSETISVTPSAEKLIKSLSRNELPYDQLPDDFINDPIETHIKNKYEPFENKDESFNYFSATSSLQDSISSDKYINIRKPGDNVGSTIDDNDNDSELYCACNYDEMLKLLGVNMQDKNPEESKFKRKDDNSSFISEVTMFSYSEDDDTPRQAKDLQNNKKTVSFLDENVPTVLPLVVNQTNSMFLNNVSDVDLFPSSVKKDKDKSNVHGKTPFGDDIDAVPLFLTTVDSVKLAKNRLSLSETPQHDIRHKNKRVEKFLRYFGEENLLTICSPAECCPVNNLLVEQRSSSELPLIPSLNSLPLNHDDLNYIANLTGKRILSEDSLLTPVDEILGSEYKWEVKYVDDDPERNKSKWLKAFAEAKYPSTSYGSNYTDDPDQVSNRFSTTNFIIREDSKQLPTIAEEEYFWSDEKAFNMPYTPSIPSLPLDEEEIKELLKQKPRPSILKKNNTMELRYFTVEFPMECIAKNKSTELCAHRRDKSSESNAINKIDVKENRDLKTGTEGLNYISPLNNEDQTSCESFYSCCSNISLSSNMLSVNCDALNRSSSPNNTGSSIKAVEEMVMLSAIYMCDLGEGGEVTNLWKSSHDSMINHSPTNSLNCLTLIPLNPKNNSSHTIFKDNKNTTDTVTMKNEKEYEISSETQQQPIIRNGSYTIYKNRMEEINTLNKQHFQSNYDYSKSTLKKSYTILKNCDKYQREIEPVYTNYNTDESHLNTLQTPTTNVYAVNENKKFKESNEFVYKNHHLLQPENITIPYQNITLDQSKIVNMPLKKSVDQFIHVLPSRLGEPNIPSLTQTTATKNAYSMSVVNQQQQRNQSAKQTSSVSTRICNTVRETPGLKPTPNHGQARSPNLENPEQQSQNSRTFKCQWPKVKLHNLNLQSYTSIQRPCSKATFNKKGDNKTHRELKRKPKFLLNSPFKYRRSECKRTLPKLHFVNMFPVVVSEEMPVVVFRPNVIGEVTKSKSKECGNVFYNNSNKTIEEERAVINNEYGINKAYISVKNLHLKDDEKTSCKSSGKSYSNYELSSKLFEKKLIIENHEVRKARVLTNNSFNSLMDNDNSYTMFSESQPTKSTLLFNYKTSQENVISNTDTNSGQEKQLISMDQNVVPFSLYNTERRPLTDVHHLRKINGTSLLRCEKTGLPICDYDNNLIFDSYWYTLSNHDFNSPKPHSAEILKSFASSAGHPMVQCDAEGYHLTSVRGSMMGSSSGKGFI